LRGKGSGKTAAFALPVLQSLLNSDGHKGLFCLVLSPTRFIEEERKKEERKKKEGRKKKRRMKNEDRKRKKKRGEKHEE
jgi:hypothetical protein